MSPKPVTDEGVPMNVSQSSKHEQKLKQEAQNMGKFGVWFGAKDNAAVYFAGIIAIALLLIMGLIVAFGGDGRLEMAKLFGSLFLATIGYLFGSLSGRR